MGRDRRVIEQELLAQLNAQHFRRLKLAGLRWLAVSSLPIWLQEHWGVVPGFPAWLTVLAEGYCLAMSAAYAALECRWARRAAEVGADSSGVVIDRPLAAPLLSALTATAWIASGPRRARDPRPSAALPRPRRGRCRRRQRPVAVPWPGQARGIVFLQLR